MFNEPSAQGLTETQVQTIISSQSGFATYKDSEHTSVLPQIIASGATAILTNNADSVIETQMPTDATEPMWNALTSKIVPIHLNDYYTWVLRFKAKNSVGNGGYMQIGVDIGGTFGTIFVESYSFIRGADVEQSFNVTLRGYTGSTFMANGGQPKLTSTNGITTIYDKEWHLIREHKGR